MQTVFLISGGAILGALLRWQLGLWLNVWLTSIAFGTLLANLLGCLLIGMALALNLNDSAKLLFITGFLGSFTTFSAFPVEVTQRLLEQKWLNALAIFSLHNLGGLLATLVGFYIVRISIK